MDDDTEDDISLTDDLKCSLIPNGPYPLVTKGTFNYFNSSPQGRVSHFKSKKAAVTKKHVKEAWASFLTVCNMTKDGMKKVNARICKIQSFYLSHHSQREVIIEKLEENSYAYLQSAIDRSREKIFDDEITDFISNSTKESKCLIIVQVWNISLFPRSIHVI